MIYFNKNNQWRPYFILWAVALCSYSTQANSSDLFRNPPGNLVCNSTSQDAYHAKVSFIFSDSLQANIHAQKKGWEILFGGKNMNKWRGKNSESFPSARWEIKDGALSLNTAGKGAGDIITRDVYSNFELVADFKLTREANSGIKYFVGEVKNKKTGKVSINGPEYQIIDDYNHPEIKDHQHDVSSTGSCYLLYTPKNKKLHPEGQWNRIKIIARGKHVEHWLNGVMVVSYERGSADFLNRRAATKFADDENYGELESGHILLTDHGDKVYFKNIKIRRL